MPEKNLQAARSGPVDVSKALKIQDRNRLFEPGYLDTETGYCIMDDGTGFVANLLQMPGVTGEMFDWVVCLAWARGASLFNLGSGRSLRRPQPG